MEECNICYSNAINEWQQLKCSHQLCYNCYLRLDKENCPFCRHPFNYSIVDLTKIKQLGINYKPYSPPAQLNIIPDIEYYNPLAQPYRRQRRNAIHNFNEGVLNTSDIQYSGLFSRQKIRRRRRNLTEEEILERRKIIKERCQQKWLRKNGRLIKNELVIL